MGWLKDVIVDVTATAVILAAVLTSNTVLSVLVWGYTGLLLLVKILVLAGGDVLNLINKTETEAPEWFSHLLYAINTGILLAYQWWYAGAGWALIWILSYFIKRKLETKTA